MLFPAWSDSMPMVGTTPIGLDFISKLKDVYSPLSKNEDERLMTEIFGLIEFSLDRKNQLPRVLDRITKLIAKYFEFKSVSLGIRGDDGLYRYVAFAGHPKDAEMALRKQKYSSEDMLDYDRYPNIRIGAMAQYNPVEGFRVDEEELIAHHRPKLLDKPRSDITACLPGDYIDFYMYGFEGRLVGWIELSETKDGRLPARSSIRWIELIARISSALIQYRMRTKEEEAQES